MSIYSPADSALVTAHQLVEMGVPVFAGRLKPNGTPDRRDRRWSEWERRTAGPKAHAAISNWSEGEALCAVTGVVFDVIDHDLQNDPTSVALKQMSEDLDENGPEVHLETSTPSGGTHLWVAFQDIGSHPGFRKGLDYKGGKSDGSSRGFVFLPPTVRPSKRDGVRNPYRYRTELTPVQGKEPCPALCEYVLAKTSAADPEGTRTGRPDPDRLREACSLAEAGEQRGALLRYVHELERRGYAPDDIVVLLNSLKLKAYDPRRPWRERHFRELLHRPGVIIADARPGELDGIENAPKRSEKSDTHFSRLSEYGIEVLNWFASPLLPFGCMVMFDGDPGIGKSLLVQYMMCRATKGEPLFPGDEGLGRPINCAFVGSEDDIASVVVPRVIANGGDLNRIVTLPIKKKRGQLEILTFPDGIARFRRLIVSSGAEFCIVDPISSFLGEDIKSHNEASVRRALSPVGEVAQETKCCILFVRHLNKDTSMNAMYRGGGSIAFSGIARSGIIGGRLPDDSAFGIAHVKSSNAQKMPGSLAYTIGNTQVKVPGGGATEMPIIQWQGPCDYGAEDIAKGLDGRSAGNGGRKPIQQELVEEALLQLIELSGGDPIPAGEAIAFLKADGCSTSPNVLAKAREAVGLRSVPAKDDRGKMQGWVWIMG
jgi:AAA domain